MDMNNNIIIYAKQPDKNPVPITARINWLPDSSIKPLMYWTPDGSCFEIKSIYNCKPIAFLKDKGEGLRFKVMAEVTKTPDWDEKLLHTQQETYLYLADDRFCGKNFIDERYAHEAKMFIPVILDIFPNGQYELISFKVRTAQYIVVKTIDVQPHASYSAGGVGIRHKVEALRLNAEESSGEQLNIENAEPPAHNETARHIGAVFYEVNKWFVKSLN